MSILALSETLIQDYERYVQSSLTVRGGEIADFLEEELLRKRSQLTPRAVS